MKLRKEQMDTFSEAARKSFEDRMVAHLREVFPQRSKRLGEPRVRGKIQHGIERAGTYGITSERDVCRYIDVMFAYGWDFDTDSKLPWAGRILNDERFLLPEAKVNRLYRAAQREGSETLELTRGTD